MTKKTGQQKQNISPAFKKDFPDHAKRAEDMGVSVRLSSGSRRGQSRAYWIEGNYQVTGFLTRVLKDKTVVPWTDADSNRYIGEVLDKIEAGRRTALMQTIPERFEAVMVDAMKAWPPIGMIGTHAPHTGDSVAFCDWHSSGRCICVVTLRDIGRFETEFVTKDQAESAILIAYEAWLRRYAANVRGGAE